MFPKNGGFQGGDVKILYSTPKNGTSLNKLIFSELQHVNIYQRVWLVGDDEKNGNIRKICWDILDTVIRYVVRYTLGSEVLNY